MQLALPPYKLPVGRVRFASPAKLDAGRSDVRSQFLSSLNGANAALDTHNDMLIFFLTRRASVCEYHPVGIYDFDHQGEIPKVKTGDYLTR